MRSKSYRINITPIPWQRIARKGNRCYDTQTREQVCFTLYLSQQHNDEPFFTNPVHLEVIFYMPIHKLVKDRQESHYHHTVPYLDNLYKFVLDAMRGVVVSDERVISSVSLKKVYDKEPRTELTITEVV